MDHKIYCADIEVGTASVDRQGLFYCVICRSRDENTELFHFLINTDSSQIDLGVCPPGGEITKRFSVNKAGEGVFRFSAVALGSGRTDWCVQEDSQFPFLTKLPQAYLRQYDGKSYIAFKDQE